jgi:HSP20 family protein
MRTLRERVDRLFDEMWGRHTRGEEGEEISAWSPAIDVIETQDSLIVQAEVPGVSKDEMSIELTNERLTLRGERKKDDRYNDAHYHRAERAFGHFQRTVNLSVPINADAAGATFANGVLEIRIPKMEEVKPKQIQIGTQ